MQGFRVVVETTAWVERMERGWIAAFGWAAYFSLLSALHIGFREFSVGTWLARLQGSRYSLEAIGWVRTMSDVQSLASLFLLAMAILTYFGRPFD